MKPFAIYTRTSTKGDADDNRRQSHAEQRARVRRYTEQHGLPVLEEQFTDDHKSGGQMDDRPALDAAVQAIADGRAGGVIVAFLDRLSRSSEQGQRFVRELGKADPEAVVVAVDLNLTITPRMSAVDKFMFQNLLSTAEYVRNALGERIESAKERAVNAGVLVGPTPVGFRLVGNPDKDRAQWNDEERQVIVDEETAPFIRELFERRARGAGYGELARWLDGCGVIPWRVRQRAAERNEAPSHRWSRQGIAGLLQQEAYVMGELGYGTMGTVVKVEPLVDRATWSRVQKLRQQTGRRERSNPNSRWLATGLLKCMHCDSNLAPTTGSKAQGAKRRYRCVNRACPAAEQGSRVSVDAEYIERVVVAKAIDLAGKLVVTPVEEADLTALQEELAKAEATLADLSSREALEAFGREQWLAMGREAREERDRIAVELKAAQIEAGYGEGGTTTNLGQLWPDLTPAQQREALFWYLEAVRVDRPSVRGQARGRKAAIPPDYRKGDIVFVERKARPWRAMEVELVTVVEAEGAVR